MKKLTTLLLALVMALSLAPAALAASNEAMQAANSLHELGLFNGVGTNADGSINYDLDRTMTRAEAVTMLVRLLGKENEAKAQNWDMPFTDVADWAKPYVGYAYANKLTTGTSPATFGGSQNITATQYLTFVLRALGYESGKDFQWDNAWELTDQLGITKGQFSASSKFERSDAVIISNSALTARLADSEKTLFDQLNVIGFGRIDPSAFKRTYSSLVRINGNLYMPSAGFEACFTESSNTKIPYISTGGIYNLLAMILGDYRVEASANPFLSGKIVHNDSGVFFYNNQNESINITKSITWLTYGYNGSSITVPSYGYSGAKSGSVHYFDGIRFLLIETYTYASVDAILNRLNINASVDVELVPDAGYILSIPTN